MHSSSTQKSHFIYDATLKRPAKPIIKSKDSCSQMFLNFIKSITKISFDLYCVAFARTQKRVHCSYLQWLCIVNRKWKMTWQAYLSEMCK